LSHSEIVITSSNQTLLYQNVIKRSELFVTDTLSPSQQQELDRLNYGMDIGNVFVVYGGSGMGKTTLLQTLQEQTSGAYVSMREFLTAMRGHHPLAMEEAFEQILLHALATHETVILDDLHLLYDVVCGCGFNLYPRSKFLNAVLTNLVTKVGDTPQKLIFGMQGSAPAPIRNRAYSCGVDQWTAKDYAFLCRAYLPQPLADSLDIAKIHRFAPKLNAHQIKSACLWLGKQSELTTDGVIEYLRSQRMVSNVDLEEVQAAELSDLKGINDIVRQLEANIILPLEDDALALELDIKPKRGVLLAGPPGTGKTTVGRALAHRLKSKFFMIDGTFIAGTRDFFERVKQVFDAAKQNAPSIIFIDDSDVIFADNAQPGLYRYLLTMLDGLESTSAGRVCVMMTAMDVSKLPPALIRSGRVELWLEMRLPDAPARADILREHAAKLPPAIGTVDVEALALATDGLTGADIKRLMEDGKILFAYDRAQNAPMRPSTDYFLQAIETVRANKERYAQAEAQASARTNSNPFAAFESMMMSGMSAMEGEE
jgi:transitional endoplasmic reticulum ATPase